MKQNYVYIVLGVIVLAVLGLIIYKSSKSSAVRTAKQTSSTTVQVVAAENFYGDVTQQIGGSHVAVTSILSDPNVDPHEYESSVQDGVAVSNAQIVIENGDEYDTWMDKLLSASPNSNRTVLTGSDIATDKLEDNPHVWYGIDNIQAIAAKIDDTLKQKDPKDAAEFDKNLAAFDASLQPIEQKMNDIKSSYNNTPVGLTETIYLYQTQPMGLNVLTPIAFERAIAEGNDPSPQDVATANDQITGKQVKVLIYNVQTITPITTNLQNEAKQAGIPIVPVSETMPQNQHYQSWMLAQLTSLQNALGGIK